MGYRIISMPDCTEITIKDFSGNRDLLASAFMGTGSSSQAPNHTSQLFSKIRRITVEATAKNGLLVRLIPRLWHNIDPESVDAYVRKNLKAVRSRVIPHHNALNNF